MSTFSQFIDTFKKELPKVAEFDGDSEDQTLNVIIGALESSRLRELLDDLDGLRKSSAEPNDEADDSKKQVSGRAKRGGGLAVQTSASNDVSEEKRASKPRRVTGYNVFVAEQVKEKKTTMKDAARAWKEMNEDGKKPYNARASAQNEA